MPKHYPSWRSQTFLLAHNKKYCRSLYWKVALNRNLFPSVSFRNKNKNKKNLFSSAGENRKSRKSLVLEFFTIEDDKDFKSQDGVRLHHRQAPVQCSRPRQEAVRLVTTSLLNPFFLFLYVPNLKTLWQYYFHCSISSVGNGFPAGENVQHRRALSPPQDVGRSGYQRLRHDRKSTNRSQH